jgi:hypothetical protein
MVGHLASRLSLRYLSDRDHLLDPFCGSGAVLSAAAGLAARTTGLDLNPYAVLLAETKLLGFDPDVARTLMSRIVQCARNDKRTFPSTMDNREYWFTPGTLEKYERVRYWSRECRLSGTREGRTVLLALALTARRCSRADQRSPKPFISRTAHSQRSRRHFDPFSEIEFVLDGLTRYYGAPRNRSSRVEMLDIVSKRIPSPGAYTIAITSPPYLNAQDYYRNSKLELCLLEGLLPFSMSSLRERFIGTERGDLALRVTESDRVWNLSHIDCLRQLESAHRRHAAVVHRYFADMRLALRSVKAALRPKGRLVLVCGDNLVGGVRIPTWAILEKLAGELGYSFVDRFGDQILRRHVPPKRLGHRGLIKEEVISEFRA